MQRQPVVSSQLVSIGHDPETRTLEVEFHGGSVYRYHGVTAEAHDALMRADSIGRHFGKEVRGKYRFEKLGPEPAEEAGAIA